MGQAVTQELIVALSFDVDNDFCSHPTEGDGLLWRGLEAGSALAFDALARASDRFSIDIRSSWFVRIDPQIAAECGDLLWAAEKFGELYATELATAQHEMQWHAHLYRKQEGAWVLEDDPAAQAEQLHRSHAAMSDAGLGLRVSRIGECLFSNTIGRVLTDLGVEADSTAMPGRAIKNTFNWRTAPHRPYYQDTGDFCQAASDGLLELPFAMLPVLAPYDSAPISRYANLGFLHSAMDVPLRALVQTASSIVTIAHPFELLPEAEHPLWGASPSNFLANLESIIDEATRIGRPIRFVTMSELAALCRERDELTQDAVGPATIHQALSRLAHNSA